MRSRVRSRLGRFHYPSEACRENGGQGWSAKVAEVKYGVARLKLSGGTWEPVYFPQDLVREWLQ